MKKYSTSLIKEMQIKSRIKYYLTHVRMAIIQRQEITNPGKDVQKRNTCCVLLVRMKTASATMVTVWKFHKKLKTELLYDPAILLYPREINSGSQRDICTSVFIAS